jgi:hypothetical protein
VAVSYLYRMDSKKQRLQQGRGDAPEGWGSSPEGRGDAPEGRGSSQQGRTNGLREGRPGWPSARTIYGVIVFLTLIGIAIVALRASKLAPLLFLGRHAGHSPAVRSAFAQTDMIFERFPGLTMVHIFVALVFILTGPFQVIRPLRANYPSLQRRTDRIFWVSGFIMGVTAVVMSFVMPSIGGVNQAASTILFGVFFLFALCRALANDRSGNGVLRREWLIRAYAIALAVTSIRLVVGIFFATSRLSGLKPEEFFGIAFWIGFVIHLILAEAWIYRTRLVGGEG